MIGDGVKLDNQIQVGAQRAHRRAYRDCRLRRHRRQHQDRQALHDRRQRGHIVGHLEIADHVDISACTLVGKSIRKPAPTPDIYPFGKTRGAGASNAAHAASSGRAARTKIKCCNRSIAALRRNDEGDRTTAWTSTKSCKHLPHRYPFLLIDRVLSNSNRARASGVEERHHQRAVFPRPFSASSGDARRADHRGLAQAAAMLSLQHAWASSRTTSTVYYFVGIDRRAFQAPVMPGDN